MIKIIVVSIVFINLTGCALLMNPMDMKRQSVLACVRDMKQNDVPVDTAFEICRQIYGLHKVEELK